MNSRKVLDLLGSAESALRENLYRHDVDTNARAHMERAVCHVREAFIATNEIGKARSVQQLLANLEKADRLVEKVSQRPHRNPRTIHL